MPTIIRRFIGGPLDGKYLALSKDCPILSANIPSLVDFAAMSDEELRNEPIVTIAYRKMEFKGSSEFITLWSLTV